MNGLGTHIWPVTSFQKLMLLLPKSETRGREATLFRVGVSQGRVKGKMEPTRLDPRRLTGEKQIFSQKSFPVSTLLVTYSCVLGWKKASLMAKEGGANIVLSSHLSSKGWASCLLGWCSQACQVVMDHEGWAYFCYIWPWIMQRGFRYKIISTIF